MVGFVWFDVYPLIPSTLCEDREWLEESSDDESQPDLNLPSRTQMWASSMMAEPNEDPIALWLNPYGLHSP